MRNKPSLTTSRAVEIYKEMLECRRMYCADNDFFKMTELWEYMCEENEEWSIKTYRSNNKEDLKRKAGVASLEHRVKLTADSRLMGNANQGCKLSNFILAHEMGHVALRHHAKNAITKNFQLFAGPNGMSNLPPTLEELEANYAAVFLQCGAVLTDVRWDPIELAHRACSDVHYVKKAQRTVRLDAFQRELSRQKRIRQRVIL